MVGCISQIYFLQRLYKTEFLATTSTDEYVFASRKVKTVKPKFSCRLQQSLEVVFTFVKSRYTKRL